MRPTTHQLRLAPKGGTTYEDEYGIHLFKPFFLALAVDDRHSWVLKLDDVRCCDCIMANVPSL